MTDKKIIIDGVNVAGCYYLKYDKIGCDIDECYCVGNDCYYKQLRRKEQECEELKVNAKDTYELYKALQESFEILLEENNKLKEKLY